MNTRQSSENLVQRMEDLLKQMFIPNKSNLASINRTQMDYFPYLNWNLNTNLFEETSNVVEQSSFEDNQTFLIDQSIEIIRIKSLSSYLYRITVRHGCLYQWTIEKHYRDILDLHQSLLDYLKSQSNEIIDKETPYYSSENDRIPSIEEFSIDERCRLLQIYLNQLFLHREFREHSSSVKIFLEVSQISFGRGLGKSLREGYLLKRLYDDQHGQPILKQICLMYNMCKIYTNRKWFVIKDSYLTSIELQSGMIGFPMLVDQEFSLERNFSKTGTLDGIKISNSQRLLILKCREEYQRDQWFNSLMEMKDKSCFSKQHRFQSFAPIREEQYARWLINGQSFMETLAKSILAAREEIFISNWWISPELMLNRTFQDQSMRLDHLLGKRAEEGIRVYIIIYKDSPLIGLNSFYTKKKLIKQSPKKKNIKVIRQSGAFLYSNHEKIVIIDQRIAFIGGIDLSWGRWDTNQYRLVDLDDQNITQLKTPEQLRNQSEQQFEKEVQLTPMNPINTDSSDEEEEISSELNVEDKCYLFPGKDYSNLYEKDFQSLEKFGKDNLDRKVCPRMPWHDETVVVSGEVARDCARHFIQRWNIQKANEYRLKKSSNYLLPKSSEDQQLSSKFFLDSILSNDQHSISVDAQCIRSSSSWSCGIHTIEHSIENAYIDIIDNAQDFIYIENQFFISIGEDSIVKNQISDAIYRRIIRAYLNKETFRIYILLPLLPAFSNANTLQSVLYFITKSINKGEKSLYQRLKQAGVPDPEEYLTFYGIRNWDILMGRLVTEIVYVHSKIMIVDDQICICGSANINDRSLQGDRDSEFGVIIKDRQMIDSHLNGQKQKVGLFSSTWRKKLFRHLLGIDNQQEINVDDPCSDQFYQYFRQIAKNNTRIYQEVFNTIPNNQIRRFIDIDTYAQRSKLRDTDPQTAYEKCKKIQGFIVEFPIEFLADDTTMPKWTTLEGIAPISLWT